MSGLGQSSEFIKLAEEDEVLGKYSKELKTVMNFAVVSFASIPVLAVLTAMLQS